MVTAILLLGTIITMVLAAVLRIASCGAPRTAPATENRGDDHEPMEPVRHAIRRLRVLVVDSHPFIGRAVARLLAAHEVTTATSAAAALATLALDDGFDAILYAFRMPAMSGAEFAAALAERHPDLRARLVFLINETSRLETESFAAQFQVRCVNKPLAYVPLVNCVSEVAVPRALMRDELVRRAG